MRICDCEKNVEKKTVEEKFCKLAESDKKYERLRERKERYSEAIKFFKDKNTTYELKESFNRVINDYRSLELSVEDALCKRDCLLEEWKDALMHSTCDITDDYFGRILKDMGEMIKNGDVTSNFYKGRILDIVNGVLGKECPEKDLALVYIDMAIEPFNRHISRIIALRELVKLYGRFILRGEKMKWK